MYQEATNPSYANIEYFRDSGRLPQKIHLQKALGDGKDVVIDFPIGDPKRIEGMHFQDKYTVVFLLVTL